MNKIKVKDEVILVAGKDKGSTGIVTRFINNKVVVEGLNLAKKHVKPNPNAGVVGGIIDTEMSMDVSNIAIYNTKTKKADKVGMRIDKDGNKERFFKSNGDSIV